MIREQREHGLWTRYQIHNAESYKLGFVHLGLRQVARMRTHPPSKPTRNLCLDSLWI
jgi:hypothetical protein